MQNKNLATLFKVRTFWKAYIIWKKYSSWFWRLLSKSADLSKPCGRFFQILCVSQKVRTLLIRAIELTFLLAVLKWIEINSEVGHSFFQGIFLQIWYSLPCSDKNKKQILMKYVKEYSIWIDWTQICVRDF